MDFVEIIPGLSVGGWGAAKDHAVDFDHVVNCAFDAPHTKGARFQLADGPGNDPNEMDKAANEVAQAIRDKKKLLVHCVAGFSRSVVVTALGMQRAGIGDFETNLLEIMRKRDCQPTRPFRPHDSLVEMARNLAKR